MKTRCLLLTLLISSIAYSLADEAKSHKLVKRQSSSRSGSQGVPLSRSRQFPPPEELESSEYVNSEDEEEDGGSPISAFRGRPPQRPPPEEEYVDDYSDTETPKKTTSAPQKPTARTVIFNNRFSPGRSRFGSQSSTTATATTTTTAKPTTAASNPRSRSRATPAQSQRLDVVANILNKPAPQRASERSIPISRTSNLNAEKKPVETNVDTPARSNSPSSSRPRTRGRFRTRASTTTTTTTTTTTEAPLPGEEYYYYYDEDEDDKKGQAIATTTSTTTTTTPKPSLPRRVAVSRRPSGFRSPSTAKPAVKFDLESQFAPPPEDPVDVLAASSSTKKFSTTSTTPAPAGGIPAHLRSKYRDRTDGRFIDFLRDPNRPRELKGFDLTDYPFYITVPEDIEFDCNEKKDGYYASIPHRCQLFHYCFAGARYDFLCANYTLYDQTTFTCRFANNVDCESSASYYYRNDDLWKETTTVAPQTTTPRKRRTTPKDEDYDDDYDYEEYDDDEERRRGPPKRTRNRRKNKRKPQEEEK